MRGYSDSSRGNGVAGRARAARLALALVFLALASRLVHLQVVAHAVYKDKALHNILREEVVPAIRGVIRDRHGRVLVDSVPSFTVALDPYDAAYMSGEHSVGATLEELAPIIGVPVDSMMATIDVEKRRSYRRIRLARHLSREMVAYLEERRDYWPGVRIEVEPMRRHVYGTLAAHVLGHVGEVSQAEIGQSPAGRTYRSGDRTGRTGIERLHEAALCGRNGRRMVEVSALGRRVAGSRISRHASVEPPSNGQDVFLTLDLDVQQAAEDAFPEEFAGSVVVLDVRDGGVLAMLSRPAIDPNEFARGLSAERWRELNSDPLHPQHNRSLMSGYPPGSVFKAVTALAALGPGGVSPRQVFAACEGGWKFGNRWFGCHHVHGTVAFEEAMLLSCDTYFYQVGLKAGLDALVETALALGFHRPTGIELTESVGLVPDRQWYDRHFGKRGWTRGYLLNLSIGQGEILATPLQIAGMMAAIARDGRPVTPHLVQRVGDRVESPTAPGRRLDVAPATLRTMQRALEQVVAHPRGTGKASRVPGIRIAGKTGTSQNPHGEDHALFAGYAPSDAPRIAFAVVVENGGHGGETAAPVAARIIAASLVDRQDLWAGGAHESVGADPGRR